jgi:hypothetical protein
MIAHILLSVGIIALAMLSIGMGLLFGRSAPKGSCGGLSALGLKDSCALCSNRKDCPHRHR